MFPSLNTWFNTSVFVKTYHCKINAGEKGGSTFDSACATAVGLKSWVKKLPRQDA